MTLALPADYAALLGNLKTGFPDMQGFSPHCAALQIIQQPAGQTVQQPVSQIPWDHSMAESALHGVNRPLGISTHILAGALPPELRGQSPSVEELERKFEGMGGGERGE